MLVLLSGFAVTDTTLSKPGSLARTQETGHFWSSQKRDGRVLVTIDTDFGELIHLHDVPHAGLVRLPDVPAGQRIGLMAELVDSHREALETRSIVTVRGGRIRISKAPRL